MLTDCTGHRKKNYAENGARLNHLYAENPWINEIFSEDSSI